MPTDNQNKVVKLEDFASDVSSIYIDPNNFSMNLNAVAGDYPEDNTPHISHSRQRSKCAKKVKLISEFVKELEQHES